MFQKRLNLKHKMVRVFKLIQALLLSLFALNAYSIKRCIIYQISFMHRIITLCVFAFFASSCGTGKKLAFFKDLNSDDSKKQEVRTAAEAPLRLQSDDQVQVVVSSISPEAAIMFNLMGTSVMNGANTPQMMQSVYTITPSGNITIPGIGDIKVAGLTTDEAKLAIKNVVAEYLKDAVISVTLVNFRITVMGEVARPATYPVGGEKINVLQALGMAGDMTVYGNRANVKVFRKGADRIEVGTLNINNSNVMRSPFYDLRQNDVVLVEPTKRKGLQADGLNIIVPAATSILSLIIVAITRFW